ncbi:MAG: SDR family oxidoreductase [Kiritimatiellia bacterium]
MPTSTLIIGATSAMAEHCARKLAAEGDRLLLAARSPERLEILAEDLCVRGASEVIILPAFDALDPDSFPELIRAAGEFERVLIAHGHLPEQSACEQDFSLAATELQINLISVIALCTLIVPVLEQRGGGTLAVISSVAGLRGRQSNFIYGTAKGGLNLYLQGLRNRLFAKGIRVITILPGFVDTPMTADLDKGPLFVSAEKAGACIHHALTQGKGDVVYVPFFWRYILWVIRAIPETLFKRLKL